MEKEFDVSVEDGRGELLSSLKLSGSWEAKEGS